MHGIAIPSPVTWQNKRWKPSIDTSIECFFNITTNKESMEELLKKHLRSCDKKEIQYFPLIFGIGDDEKKLSEYVVAIGEVFYTFQSFIEAMDAAFKCFIFYKIPFPPQVLRFWSLMNEIFYKIKIPQLELTSTLSAVLKSFD